MKTCRLVVLVALASLPFAGRAMAVDCGLEGDIDARVADCRTLNRTIASPDVITIFGPSTWALVSSWGDKTLWRDGYSGQLWSSMIGRNQTNRQARDACALLGTNPVLGELGMEFRLPSLGDLDAIAGRSLRRVLRLVNPLASIWTSTIFAENGEGYSTYYYYDLAAQSLGYHIPESDKLPFVCAAGDSIGSLSAYIHGGASRDLGFRFDSVSRRCLNPEGQEGNNPQLLAQCGTFERLTMTTADLQGADFRGAIFKKTNFDFAKLSGSNMTGAYLAGAQFKRTTAVATRFDYADLSNANFDRSFLRGSSFLGADLKGAIMVGNGERNPIKLVNADFRKADLRNLRYENVDFEGALYGETTKLPFPREVADELGMIFLSEAD